MNFYGGYHDYSLYVLDLGVTDPTLIESLSGANDFLDDNRDDHHSARSNSTVKFGPESSRRSPPKHRHDGTSPLPLGMDWSPAPRIWEGRDTVWPHDFHTGWSYCVTIPSWTVIPKPRGLDPIVFYRVQVGIQSPEGISSSRGILRRFRDFLKLASDLKKEFPKKKLPPPPSKGLLRMKSKDLMEERRSSLGDWIEKLLSDIDISRSVTVAIFIELEGAARSSFYVVNQNALDQNSPGDFVVPSEEMLNNLDGSLVADSSIASVDGNNSSYEVSDLGTSSSGVRGYSELGLENAKHDPALTSVLAVRIKDGLSAKIDSRASKVSILETQENFHDGMAARSDSASIDQHSLGIDPLQVISHHGGDKEHLTEAENFDTIMSRENLESKISASNPEVPRINDSPPSSKIFSRDLSLIAPAEDQSKMNRILTTVQQRISIAKTDVEDLITRLNQELSVRQYLSTKVQDLELELETMKLTREESLQQAVIVEKEKVTQVQWDMEELRRKFMELELKLRNEQEEKALLDSTKNSIALHNDRLQRELDVTKEQVSLLQKQNQELGVKSKLDLKTLAKEVKSLRNSQSELKQELVRLRNEKVDAERILQEERQRRQHSDAANAKLLHECQVLRSRLEECRVPFLIEEENNLNVDTSTPSEAIDLLSTSDNRIGLLLAEAQLLGEDVEKEFMHGSSDVDDGHRGTPDEAIRKMLADVLVDCASQRIQMNSLIRCAISSTRKSEKDGVISPGESLLGKLLDRGSN